MWMVERMILITRQILRQHYAGLLRASIIRGDVLLVIHCFESSFHMETQQVTILSDSLNY